MTRLRSTVAIVAVLACSATTARADVVLQWNEIAVATLISQGQSPFAQARYMAITQLAVFEAVNAIKRDYKPYLGTVEGAAGASAEAAAVAAAHVVLKHYFPAAAGALDAARAASLAAIHDSPAAKMSGMMTGEAAATLMIAERNGDGSSPAKSYVPTSFDPGDWQTTPTCTSGVNYQWQDMRPFGIPTDERPTDPTVLPLWVVPFLPGPPPALTSNRYAKDYAEVKTVGSLNSTERPTDRADVARFFAPSSPSFVFNLAARQVAVAQRRSLSENARALALINMATSDSLVASFAAKYHYNLWRPYTAIRNGSLDGNPKTDADLTFVPYILTPCFPSYPSNHGSGSSSAAEILRRVYGAGGHDITIANPAVANVTLHYTTFKEITDDISDARVFGGIHFRFDQEAGGRLGRTIATYIYKHNLRRVEKDDDENEDE